MARRFRTPAVVLTALSLAVPGVGATVAAPARAGGPAGVIDTGVVSRAVGSGVRDGVLIGFSATGPDNPGASAAVIAACQATGAQQCSSDEVTNDVFCVVSVGEDISGVVAGGAGMSVEAARDDAFRNVTKANLTLGPNARILASSCPT